MSRRFSRWFAIAPVAAAATGIVLWACSDQTGPQSVPGYFGVAPVFTSASAGIVPVARGRFTLHHLPDDIPVQDTVIDIPPAADSVDLTLSVPLLHAADSFALRIALVGFAGDTVFRAGPITVHPVHSGPAPVVDVPLDYVGVGADAATVEIVSGVATLQSDDVGAFSAVARDSQGGVIEGTPIAWGTLDPALVTVSEPDTGLILANSQRGTARVVAQLLTGPSDTASVIITLPPASIVADSGASQTGPAGIALPSQLVARVLASDGVGVPDVLVQFADNLGGSLAPTSALTDADGRARTAWTLGNVAGGQVATATTAELPGQTATFGATATATGPGVVTISGGNLQTALVSTAVPVDPTVLVTDLQSNPVQGVSVTFVVAGGGGSVTAGFAITNASGLASVGSWTLGPLAGLNTLTATVTGLTPVAFFALGTAAGGATSMTLNAGDGQTALANTAVAIPPSVLVTDTLGNPVSGVTIGFAIGAGAGNVGNPTAVTDGAGVATAGSWTLGTAGANTLVASLTGLPDVTFSATATIGTPAAVIVVSGDGQSADFGTALAQPLVIEVQDSAGNPVPSTSVTWTALQGSVVPTSGPTDAAGRAQTSWTLGTNAITQTTTASVSGVTPAVFTATAIFPTPTILMMLSGTNRIPAGGQATLDLTLTAPAPVGGTTVTVTSDNTALVTVVGPGTATIAEGQTTGSVTLNGVTSGTTTVRANAPGYSEGTLPVTVSVQILSMPTTLNVPFGQSASLPVQISTPAPTGGTVVTLVSSNPSVVGVTTGTVTIPEGLQTANGTLSGVFPGTTTVTGSTTEFGTAQSTVSTTASINIVETSATLNATFGDTVTVRLESAGIPIAAPSPGITVDLVAGDPTCLGVAAQVTIATGLVSVAVPLAYGGSATLACTTALTASAPNITADNINVTVNPAPAITLNGATVGSGLQESASGFLGAAAPAGTVIRVTSGTPGVALVSPNATTPGTPFADIPLTVGATSFTYFIHGVEGQTGASVLTATSALFSTGTITATIVAPALDIIFLNATTTTLTASDQFQVRTGTPNGQLTGISAEQAIRAGGATVTATIVNSDGVAAQLVAAADTGNTVTTTVVATQARSPFAVASGGVELDPLAAGSTTVSATIPGFVVLPSASVTVTITAPAITANSLTVGGGLQESASGFLGAAVPAGTVVRVTSLDPAVAQVAPDATTPGAAFIDIALSTGVSSFTYFVQGVENQTGAVGLEITAPGYTADTATATVVAPALDIIFLNTTTTTLTASDPFQVRLGVPNGPLTAIAAEQALRAGAATVTASITSSSPGVGQLVTQALIGGAVTVDVVAGQARSPGTVATGGVELDPLTAGTTTVAATIPGFVVLPTASVTVTVSAPGITMNATTVGSGLQEITSGSLGAPAPDTTFVSVVSSNPGVVLVSPDASTAGVDSIAIRVLPGASSFTYFVQGLEAATGTVSIRATASGYTDGSTTSTAVQPALDIIFLNTSTGVGDPDDLFQVRLGTPNAINTGINAEQSVRAGGPAALIATITNSSAAVAQLVFNSGAANSGTVTILQGQARSPGTVAAGGVAFDGLAAGSTTVAATIPGFIVLPTASVVVTVTP